jgi:hypothetical protein
MKAVSVEGEIVGWICWAFIGFAHHVQHFWHTLLEWEPHNRKKKRRSVRRSLRRRKKCAVWEERKEMIKEFGAFTNAPMREWEVKLTLLGSKCIILVAILILSAYQGKGAAFSLNRYGG